MTYETNPFSRLPIKVITSDAPYRIQLEVGLNQCLDMPTVEDTYQALRIQATVHVHSRKEALGLAAELRAAADSIEAFAPKMWA